MSTKPWLCCVAIIFLVSSVVTYPGYDRVVLAAPVWLWVNFFAVVLLFGVNAARAARLEEEGGEV